MSSSPSCLLNPTLSLHSRSRPSPLCPSAPSISFPISRPSSSLFLALRYPKTHRLQAFFSKPPDDAPNHDLEESRWLREEQRWLREEQRWLREEQRWVREKESLLGEIAKLKLHVQALESEIQIRGGDPVKDAAVPGVAALLQVLKERNLIAESGSSASPMVLQQEEDQEGEEKVVGAVEEVKKAEEDKNEEGKSWRALRMGAEGDEVRALQEALERLGFYSGEEDMEYSSFSSGTERAVKTWQASVGAKEDGIMTSELLGRLYFGKQVEHSDPAIGSVGKDGANGAAVSSATEISEIQQTLVKESDSEFEISQQRVFLLGENRWEEPSRLAARDKQAKKSKSDNTTTKCLACRGEGRLMCTECDGTGEPNIEPQFMEWVDEGAKCPYCEGLGYTICDVCEGKTVV